MVVWTNKAISDLKLLSSIIQDRFNNELADKIIDELMEFVETQLKVNRELGISFEAAPHYRYLVYKGNKIFYTPYEDKEYEYVVHVVARNSDFKIENLED